MTTIAVDLEGHMTYTAEKVVHQKGAQQKQIVHENIKWHSNNHTWLVNFYHISWTVYATLWGVLNTQGNLTIQFKL